MQRIAHGRRASSRRRFGSGVATGDAASRARRYPPSTGRPSCGLPSEPGFRYPASGAISWRRAEAPLEESLALGRLLRLRVAARGDAAVEATLQSARPAPGLYAHRDVEVRWSAAQHTTRRVAGWSRQVVAEEEAGGALQALWGCRGVELMLAWARSACNAVPMLGLLLSEATQTRPAWVIVLARLDFLFSVGSSHRRRNWLGMALDDRVDALRARLRSLALRHSVVARAFAERGELAMGLSRARAREGAPAGSGRVWHPGW